MKGGIGTKEDLFLDKTKGGQGVVMSLHASVLFAYSRGENMWRLAFHVLKKEILAEQPWSSGI